MSNESIEQLLYTHDEVAATDPELCWLKESDHERIVKELEARIAELEQGTASRRLDPELVAEFGEEHARLMSMSEGEET